MKSAQEKKSNEQTLYASLLLFVSTIGYVFLVSGFLIYVLEILPPSTPIAKIASFWDINVTEFRIKADFPSGWELIHHLDKGDMVSLVSILFLASVSLFCFFPLALYFFGKKDFIYFVLALVQIITIILAASGIFVH